MKNENNNTERHFEKKGNSWIIRKANGQKVASLGELDAYPLLSVLVVKQDELYGLINLQGELVQPIVYQQIRQPFGPIGDSHDKERHEVLLLQTQDNRYWLADKDGKIVTSRSYSTIGVSSYWRDSDETWNGFVETVDGGTDRHNVKTGLFDMVHVREVLPPDYAPGSPDLESLRGIYATGIPVYDNSTGSMRCMLIDVTGKVLISFEEGFSSIGVPSEDEEEYLIEAERDGKMGYINIHGTVKIPFRYDAAAPFEKGMAVVGFVSKNGADFEYGVIDHHGKWIVPPTYELPDDARDAAYELKNISHVSTPGNYGVSHVLSKLIW